MDNNIQHENGGDPARPRADYTDREGSALPEHRPSRIPEQDPSTAHSGTSSGIHASAGDATPVGEGREGAPPLSLSTLGRFFAVPLVIIGSIVGGAVVVVLLFGGSSAHQSRSVESLLQTLEASTGETSMGILLPREKELWQAALELSQRLDNSAESFSIEDRRQIAIRLAQMITRDLEPSQRNASREGGRGEHPESQDNRLEFMIRALGRTNTPEAVDPLLEVIQGSSNRRTIEALQALGNLHELSPARQAAPVVTELLKGSHDAAVLLTVCPVLSVLASPGDQDALDALARTCVVQDGEVAWSAALALARLGGVRCKSTLLDLLDRSFWQSAQRYKVTDGSSSVLRYQLPPGHVDAYLMAAIDASAHLDDPDVWNMIQRLQSDPSLAVRGRATEAVAGRGS